MLLLLLLLLLRLCRCVLVGIAPGAPERPALVKGYMQLYSVEQGRSQALEAHAAAFTTLTLGGKEVPVISFAQKTLAGGQVGAEFRVLGLGFEVDQLAGGQVGGGPGGQPGRFSKLPLPLPLPPLHPLPPVVSKPHVVKLGMPGQTSLRPPPFLSSHPAHDPPPPSCPYVPRWCPSSTSSSWACRGRPA